MTAPVVDRDASVETLLSLVDVSRMRSQALEDALLTEVEQLYAQRFTEQSSEDEEEEHPFLTTVLLLALTALFRRSYREGVEEGILFVQQQLSVVNMILPSDIREGEALSADSAFVQTLIKDFLSGQAEVAKTSAPDRELAAALMQRAKIGIVTSFHAGRGVSTASVLEAVSNATDFKVHKMWVARFDTATKPCPFCIKLHGWHMPIDEDFPMESPDPYLNDRSGPPRHPYCRCSLILFLPDFMNESGVYDKASPVSMSMFANSVLSEEDRWNFVAASIVKVEPYNRVVNGRTQQVQGYYFDVEKGTKVPSSQVTSKVSRVSLHKAKEMSKGKKEKQSARDNKDQMTGVVPKGTYHIRLPDGTVTEVVVSKDGSSRTVSNGETESADPNQTFQFMSYWQGQGEIEQIDGEDTGLHDVEHPSIDIGGVNVTQDHVKSAIDLLKQEPSTSVKAPLKNADHPLADANLRKFADEHHGINHHYSKLQQGVIDALDNTLKGKDPKAAAPNAEPSAPEPDVPPGPETPTEDTSPPLSPGEVNPAALPSADLQEWQLVIDLVSGKPPIAVQPGVLSSGIAAALQKVASTARRHYVHSDDINTNVSVKLLPIIGSGSDFMAHANGSVWQRTLDDDGVEKLKLLAQDRVRGLVAEALKAKEEVQASFLESGFSDLDEDVVAATLVHVDAHVRHEDGHIVQVSAYVYDRETGRRYNPNDPAVRALMQKKPVARSTSHVEVPNAPKTSTPKPDQPTQKVPTNKPAPPKPESLKDNPSALEPVSNDRPSSTKEAPKPESKKPDTKPDTEEKKFTPRAGMHEAADSDHERLSQDGIKVPPAWTEVQVSDDPEAGLQVIGKDSKGRAQYVYSSSHTEKQSAAKFARIKALRAHMGDIDNAIQQDAADNDHAAALMLIRRLGLRPGSDEDTGAEKKAFGATNMLAEHVQIDGDSVHLSFTGKKGVDLDFTVKDPELAAVLKSRVEGKSPQEKLFETNERRTAAYLHAIARGFKVKDLRTYYGTMYAFKIVEGMEPPKTAAEVAKARREVARQVSEKLGNTPTVALASYIDPAVFAAWERIAEAKEAAND